MGKTPIYFFPLGSVHGQIASLWISVLVGGVAVLKLLFDLLTRGPRAFFSSRDRTGSHRPACLDAYGRHRHIRLPGQDITLHCVEAGDRDRPLILFVHGFPECWFSWRRQIETFKSDYRVVAVDMRGYGDSDKPAEVSDYAFHILVADLVELIEILLREGSGTCSLVGHDWGGLISWTVAQTRPDLVRQLAVFNAPHIDAWKYRLATSWHQYLSAVYIFLFGVPAIPEWLLGSCDMAAFDHILHPPLIAPNSDEIDAYKHYYRGPSGFRGPLNYYRALLRGYGSGERIPLTKIHQQTRVLIVWGRQDVALVSELADDSAKLCAGTARIVYVDDGQHWVHLEKPQLANRLLRTHFSDRD